MEVNMTKGSPWKHLLFFALPVFAGNMFQYFYNMVDTAVVGRFVGVDALAAVGATGSLTFCLTGAISGLSGGFAIWISRFYGAKEPENLKQYTGASYMLGILASFLLTACGIVFMKPLFALLKTPDSLMELASRYMMIIIMGSLATMAYNLFAGLLRSVGDSRTPFYFLLISSALNILLDLLAVIVLGMGVAGAAWATVLSQLVSAILCFGVMWKRYPILRITKEHLRLTGQIAKDLLGLGIPMALQFSVCSLGAMVVQYAINQLGDAVIAAFTVGVKLEIIAEQPYIAIGAALATYVGQNLGAKEKARIYQGMRWAIVISAVCMAVMFFYSWFLAGPLTSLFVGSGLPEVNAYVQQYHRVICWFYPALFLIYVYRNGLQGIGDGFFPMLASGMELLGRAAVVFAIGISLGYRGVILAAPIAWCLALIPLIPTFYIKMRKLKEAGSV